MEQSIEEQDIELKKRVDEVAAAAALVRELGDAATSGDFAKVCKIGIKSCCASLAGGVVDYVRATAAYLN